jgi:WD40 repeat protein
MRTVLTVWDVGTGKKWAQEQYGDDNLIEHIAFHPDGQTIVSVASETIKIWESLTGREIAQLEHSEDVYSVEFITDQYLAVVGKMGEVQIWDYNVMQQQKALQVELSKPTKPVSSLSGQQIEQGSQILSIATNPHERTLALGGDDDTLIWDMDANQELTRLDGVRVWSNAFSPDGKNLVSLGIPNQNIIIWDLESAKVVSEMNHASGVMAVTFSPNGLWIASGGTNGIVKLWDVDSGQEIKQMDMEHLHFVQSLAFSPDGKWLGSAGDIDGIIVWDVSTQRKVKHLQEGEGILSIAFSRDGQWFASASSQGIVKVYDGLANRVVVQMLHNEAVNAIAFSPDGKWLASGTGSHPYMGPGEVRIWKVATWKEMIRQSFEEPINAVAFDSDGQLIISRGSIAQVWDWQVDVKQQIDGNQ